MDLAHKLTQFENRVRQEATSNFPETPLTITERQRYLLKIRIELGQETFIDVFYNPKNERTDFSLIQNNRRIFGYDNLGGWHRHPTEDPASHVPCDEPALDRVFLEIRKLLLADG